MSKYKIETGVPIPAQQWGKHPNRKYPFLDMKVNDSVFCEATSLQTLGGSINHAETKIGNGCKFLRRTVTENGVKGVRVWRIA